MATVDNKKIAKNTIMLYIRMLLIMAVTLYTSRVVLKILGIDDYGIYNLIAGFVTLFSFISNALISSMQRYFNICLGTDDKEQYKNPNLKGGANHLSLKEYKKQYEKNHE